MSKFMGMPIEGRVYRSAAREVQLTMDELTPRIEKILSDPRVEAIRWTQYTPYFNDGEPCVFGLRDLQVKVADGPEEDSYNEAGFYDTHSVVVTGGRMSRHNRTKGVFEDYGPVLPRLDQADEILKLAELFLHFEDVLRDTFGDHAIVTVSTDTVTVERYDHE